MEVAANQLPDGIAAVKGTGHCNVAQGLAAVAFGAGAGLSNIVLGFIVRGFGYPARFLSLAAVAVVALVSFWTLMPATGAAALPSTTA